MSAELILSIVITLATISYTYINYRMLVESQESRLLKITPVIIPFFNTSENNSILVLHIKNIGEGLAKNVKATIAEDYEMFGIEKYKLSEVGIFESGFEIFPPDFELKFNINMMRDSYKIDQDNIMRLTFEYENIHGRKYNNEYNIPFNQIFGMAHSNPPGDYLGQIPFYLKKINIKLDQIKRKL